MLNDNEIHVEKNLQFPSQSDNLPIYYDIYMPQSLYDKNIYASDIYKQGDIILPKNYAIKDSTQKNDVLKDCEKKDSNLMQKIFITEANFFAKEPTIIQIAHGMVEHKERYEWLCENLALHGYIVAINDHRGHGKSIDSNHPWGEMSGISANQNATNDNEMQHKDGFHKAIEDLHSLTQILQKRFKNHRLILLGHSMGSLLSRGYLKKHGELLDALILSGSPAYNPMLSLGIKMSLLFRSLGANRLGKNLINNLSFGGFNKPFARKDKNSKHSTGEFAWLNRDAASVRAYCDDEACQFIFSLNSFIALFRGTLWVQKPIDFSSKLQDSMLKKPKIYMISGASDSCGDFGRGVQKIAKVLQDENFHVTLQLYPEARHEIFHEINKQEVLRDLLEWLSLH